MSISTQHTPGPWLLNTQYADIEVRGPADSGVLIATMAPWGDAADAPSPQAANARLIAAAPELLKTLVGLLDSMAEIRSGDFVIARDSVWLDAAESVIAKATGSAA